MRTEKHCDENIRDEIEDNIQIIHQEENLKASHYKNCSQEMNLELLDDNLFSNDESQLISNGTGNLNKRQSGIGTNPTSGSKAPLEVINEINVDVSRDSHEHHEIRETNPFHGQSKYPEVQHKKSRHSQNGNGNENEFFNSSLQNEKNEKEENTEKYITPNKEGNLSHTHDQKIKKIKVWQNITSIIPESRLLNCTEGMYKLIILI